MYTCTVSDMVSKWKNIFSDKQISEPDSSASLIVAHVMGKKMIHEVDTATNITPDIEHKINMLCQKRLERVPVQYIIGEWDFHDMTLEMKCPVLIPRPETEELAEMIRSDWASSRRHSGTILDIGCGSGAISLYLVKNLPKIQCVAIDVNKEACDLTMRNARRLNLQDRLQVIHGDIQKDEAVSQLKEIGPYDIIVSNPPYVTSREMRDLDPEIYRFEDHKALDGGKDGLNVVRSILQHASQLLRKPHGMLWLEVGIKHPDMIQNLTHLNSEWKLKYLQTILDVTNRERFCKIGLSEPYT